MGRIERHSLIGEIIGSLGGSRTGVHVELERRDGRHLAVFRPANEDHRVIDIGLRTDVTAEFAAEDGSCDLLAAMGLDADEARRVLRLDAAGLAADSHHDDALASLAGLDQRRVWAARAARSAAEGDLPHDTEDQGPPPTHQPTASP